jgi:starch phosphorylase
MAASWPGDRELAEAAANLGLRLPAALQPLARVAYNFAWSWLPDGEAVFQALDPERWERCGQNPVRLLEEASPAHLAAAADTPDFVARAEGLAARLDGYLADAAATPKGGPVAFFCAEFGIHQSLPFYAGGLGVLAGDYLKEASDQDQPVAGVGLFYAQGSFHQRLDITGMQHEYWLATDSDRLPAVLVRGDDGSAFTFDIDIRGRPVAVQVWRLAVGRVPLYLLDTNVARNAPADRWITARLYVGDRALRLAQYAVLGIGGVTALAALAIEPSAYHLNEGHTALAALELMWRFRKSGMELPEAIEAARAKTMLTTHTPVPAGNERFDPADMEAAFPALLVRTGLERTALYRLGRVHPDDAAEPFGFTPLALRLSGAANGVSRLHGAVARSMWRDVWPETEADRVPVDHVTNGVHLATWMAPQMHAILDRYVEGWREATPDSALWDRLQAIPATELWDLRNTLRRRLAAVVRERSVSERLGRGEAMAYAESAVHAWRDDVLTIGFARRIATYKRLYLLIHQIDRAVRQLNSPNPVQVVIAGRAHPSDEGAKHTVQAIFAANDLPNVGGRVVFLEDHDLDLGRELVRGCDLWLNLPRARQEACGTSGMKSAMNGGLQLSVLDGWWEEAFNGVNGWGIRPDETLSPEQQDEHDARAFYDLLEFEVIPLFNDRDSRGIPAGWVSRMRESLRTIVPRYSASRMSRDYAARIRRLTAGEAPST